MQHLFLECALRAALIAAGTAAALGILRIRAAGARHRAWASVVMVMLLLPIWIAWGPKAPVPVLPALAAPGASQAIPLSNPLSGRILPTETKENGRPDSGSLTWNWRMGVVGLYLVGAAALLARLAFGTVRAHLLVRNAGGSKGRLTSSSCAAPVTVGWFHPVVILPERWRAWPQKQLDAVLAHEDEHARRRDPLVQWLALLNRAVFWFHPLAWWLERRLSGLAEEACDAAVLARGHDPYEYSECLLDLAQSVVRSGARVNVWGMTMPGTSLPKRIRQILEGRPEPRSTRARMACLAVACSTLSIVFAAGAIEHRKPEPAVTGPAAHSSEAGVHPASPKALGPLKMPAVVLRPATVLAQVRTSAPAVAQADPAPQRLYKDHRLLVMYFDIPEMAEADLARAVAAAQKFVRERLQPQDLLAIMAYRSGTVQVLEDFNNDSDRLVKAIQQLAAVPNPNGGEVSRANSRSMVLRTAIQLLDPVGGKKALIFFTGGESGVRESQAETQETIDAAIHANVAIYFVDSRGIVAEPQRF